MKRKAAPYFSEEVIRANRFYRKLPERKDYWADTDPGLVPGIDTFHVAAAGFERCRPGYSIQREDFPYLALEFVADGAGRLILAGEEYPLSRGTLFVYGPGVAQIIDGVDPPGLGKYFLNITGPRGLELLAGAGLKPGTMAQVAAPGELEPLFNELIRNGQKDTNLSGRICGTLAELILLKIKENALPFPGRNTRGYQTFRRCRSEIESKFLTLHSLEEAAEICNVDHAYLCRLFKDYAHQSPYKYLIRLKLNRAAEILHDPDVLVKEAARAVGFEDPFHFSRLFTKAFGISPNRYSSLYGRPEG